MPIRASDKVSFSKMRSVFFFGLIGILSVGFLYLIRPFFYPIFWATILAILFYPVYTKLNALIKLPTISSLISILIALVVIFVPLSLIVTLLFHQSVALYQSIVTGSWSFDVHDLASWLDKTPLKPVIASIQDDWNTYAANATKTISLFLFDNIRSLTQNSIHFIFLLFITLYTLFFFLRDGERMLRRLEHLSPLGDRYEELLYKRFTSTARATLKSTFIIGGIQGLLGGLLFWATGVQGAIIWGVIMFLLSLVPGIGAFLVWLPAGIIMLILGNVWEGVVILSVGAFVISTIDNFLRPPLIGKDTQMHPLIVLFSTLGGIILFGISGFVIGPVIAALCMSAISIYDHYYIRELKHND